MPGCWLRKGENEIMVYDIVGPTAAVSKGLKTPMIDNLKITRPVTHRNEGETLDLSGEKPVLTGTFNAGNGWQERLLDSPAEGRYLCLEAVNAIDGKDNAAIAELYVLDGNGKRLSREPWTAYYADSEDTKKATARPTRCLISRNPHSGAPRKVCRSRIRS